MSASPPATRYDLEVREAKLAILRRALDEVGGNATAAAKLLGIKRQVFYRYVVWSQGGIE